MNDARICCLDLDTFFVSVERLLDPSLIGKPVVVGGKRGGGGVVTAASYEVRPYGVRSGISLRDADRLAPPEAVFLSATPGVYSDYAQRVRDIAADFTPLHQVASIDEMYLDFNGCELLYYRADDRDADATIERVVREMTARIKSELGLPASCGIASTKAVAKVASGIAKPAGVRMVPAGREADFLAPLSVRKLPGIGPVGEANLLKHGITTLGELTRMPTPTLIELFGARAVGLANRARGIGSSELGRERPHFREHDPAGETVGSISNERTFREDTRNPHDVSARICGLVERVCWRARKRGVKARTVTLKMRYTDFHTINRSRTFAPTHSELDILPVVLDLYQQARTRPLPVRLVGIKLSNLGFFGKQLELFDARARLHHSVDSIREKYGYESVGAAASTGGEQRR